MYSEVFNAIRQAWSWYDPAKKEAKKRATIHIPQRKMDGTMSKRYTNALKCEECGQIVESLDCHHLTAVGDRPKTLEQLYESIRRLFVTANDLKMLCKPCHKKTDSYGGKKR